MEHSELLTLDEIAAVLRVKPSFVYSKTRFGQKFFPHVKIGRHLRFEKEKVLEFFKKESALNTERRA